MVHYWHNIPTELKIMVLEQYMSFPTPITKNKHSTLMRLRLLPLLRVGNTQLVQLAKLAYYQGNIFEITALDLNFNRRLPLRLGAMIRHLGFRFQSVPANHYRGLDLLWQPARERPTSWQRNIPTLKTLRIVLDARGYFFQLQNNTGEWVCADITESMVEEYQKTIREGVLLLKPERVFFEIDSVGCPWQSGHVDGGCSCEVDLEEKFKGWIDEK
jgi:hypothetical protein